VSGLDERSGELRAADGLRLFYRSWPVSSPRSVLIISHGLGEHAGRYAPLAADLGRRGVAVHALDHRGHGRSQGRRGFVSEFGEFVRDFEGFRAHVARETPPGVPTFLLGHSLGGLIAIRHLQAHPEAPLRGAILSAPLLGVAVQAPRWKTAMAGILSRIAPWVPISNGIDPAELSMAEGYAQAYRADPLVHPIVTPRLYTEFLGAIEAAFRERDTIRLPMLVLSPMADRVVMPEAVARWTAEHPAAVQVRRYEGFRHESLNERDRHRAVADVAEWMEAQVA
jgi:alpha-beta hydrolase superfamily lysophospholipase